MVTSRLRSSAGPLRMRMSGCSTAEARPASCMRGSRRRMLCRPARRTSTGVATMPPAAPARYLVGWGLTSKGTHANSTRGAVRRNTRDQEEASGLHGMSAVVAQCEARLGWQVLMWTTIRCCRCQAAALCAHCACNMSRLCGQEAMQKLCITE